MSKGATVSKTEVPAYQEQAFKDLYAAGRQVAGLPFVPYTGPMVAGFSPDQLAAFEATRGLFGETQAFSPVSQLQELAQAPLDIGAYMSPYQEAVIDPALRGIQERQDIAQQAAQEAAIKAGAFGGSRGTILESETTSCSTTRFPSWFTRRSLWPTVTRSWYVKWYWWSTTSLTATST